MNVLNIYRYIDIPIMNFATSDLCKATDSRFDQESLILKTVVFINPLREIGYRRSWSNEAHAAGKDIEELWQFINACFPDKPSNPGNIRIILI